MYVKYISCTILILSPIVPLLDKLTEPPDHRRDQKFSRLLRSPEGIPLGDHSGNAPNRCKSNKLQDMYTKPFDHLILGLNSLETSQGYFPFGEIYSGLPTQ